MANREASRCCPVATAITMPRRGERQLETKSLWRSAVRERCVRSTTNLGSPDCGGGRALAGGCRGLFALNTPTGRAATEPSRPSTSRGQTWFTAVFERCMRSEERAGRRMNTTEPNSTQNFYYTHLFIKWQLYEVCTGHSCDPTDADVLVLISAISIQLRNYD